ncbi:hypothetical protein BpHYR1_022887 [Brachionus plicatilis]|uniref:Uncharacterized protein n=1 Tax=Brachionus plicatilis TaxID=10195 RepID=A0A3M7SGB9_BRAPC|nr:hypothetical protein BpHYR1_022887 [Brachionus plicatilis]
MQDTNTFEIQTDTNTHVNHIYLKGVSNKIISYKFFLGLPLPLFSGASTFLLISLLVDACTTFSSSLSIVFLFFFVGITVSCGVSSSTSVIFRFRTLIELTTLNKMLTSKANKMLTNMIFKEDDCSHIHHNHTHDRLIVVVLLYVLSIQNDKKTLNKRIVQLKNNFLNLSTYKFTENRQVVTILIRSDTVVKSLPLGSQVFPRLLLIYSECLQCFTLNRRRDNITSFYSRILHKKMMA